MTEILPLRVGSRVKLRKPHPCRGDQFSVLRVGSQLRLRCEHCGHDMTIDRPKLEKAVKQLLPNEPVEQKGS